MIAVLLLAAIASHAQPADTASLRTNIRSRTVALPPADSMRLDSLSIAYGSFSIAGIPDSTYTLFPESALLVWKHRPRTDSLQLRYRVLPFLFPARRSHKNRDLIETNLSFGGYRYSMADSAARGFVDFNSIEYNGTYGRSLSIGNSQDVSLNSNFNLQLNGYILDSVRIEAAITDNNIPVQPDGNTQQLQEFDRLYITFEKGNHKLTAGDYNLDRPNSYFINFTKRVQGLMYQATVPATSKVVNKVGLSGSIAKGQFARNIFMGIEGNQGPYKLTGNNGEQFFIVLAGTEKVYIDGVLQERGEDRDYTINYNTGELVFMPRRLITKDKRIQVEFEYQDRNYLNTLIYAYDELQLGSKVNIRFNAYSNQDARNQPYTQTLSSDQKRFLETIGDDIDQAFYRVITPDTFAANKILYKMTDTVVNGISYDSVFVYTTDPDSAKYALGFSFVGEGRGDYIIAGANTNGRSYSWIAPEGGQRRGSYEPVVLLITPKKQQLFTLGGTWQIDSFKKVSVELGASNYAPNLFSARDKAEHWGFSGRGIYDELRYFGKKDSLGRRGLSWKNQLSGEYVQSRFRAIAPYRNVEFARDWNVPADAAPEDEQLAAWNTELKKDGLGSFSYGFTYYSRGEDYKAGRHIVNLGYNRKNVRGGATFNLMHSSALLQRTAYFRPAAFLEKTFPKLLGLVAGARFEREQNELRYAPADTLLPGAFAFDVLNFYLRNGEHKTRFELNYTLREDKIAAGDAFRRQNRGHTIDARLALYQWANHQLTFTGAYRKLLVDMPGAAAQQPGENVLGRLEYNGNIGRGFLVPQVLYEIGSGQEQKRIYTYIEVPAGQGIYMWNDYNGDGVQQANEFELALYPDQKKFIRIITPTNEYTRVNYVILNHSLLLSPESLWAAVGRKKGWQRFLGRFSDQLSLQINNRVLSGTGGQAFNPFASNVNDSNVIASITSLGNTFFFNRNSAVWGAEYTTSYNAGKSLLTYGLEGNNQLKHSLRTRWTFLRAFTVNCTGNTGRRSYRSALEDGRTYAVAQNSLEPSLTWIMRSAFRLTGGYRLDDRRNRPQYGGEQALIQSVNLDARLNRPSLGTIQARMTYASISYTGAANTSLSFVMLDALQKGTNWLWYLNWERRLSKGIELSLEYEGRKPGDLPLIHTGRMSIRAIL